VRGVFIGKRSGQRSKRARSTLTERGVHVCATVLWEEVAVPVYVVASVGCINTGANKNIAVKYDTYSGKI